MSHEETEQEREAARLQIEKIRREKEESEAADEARRREGVILGISPRVQRIYADETDPAAGAIRALTPKMECRGKFRPYLEAATFRQLLGGTRRIAILFAPFRMDLSGLDVDLVRQSTERFDLKVTVNARTFATVADGGKGIPFPIDDQGPWTLWVGSGNGNGDAYWHAQIAYYPWESLGT